MITPLGWRIRATLARRQPLLESILDGADFLCEVLHTEDPKRAVWPRLEQLGPGVAIRRLLHT